MAGTRTAPDPTLVGANLNNTTLHFIDASGDVTTDNLVTITTPTLTEIEDYASAYQAATQASLWKITLSTSWQGDEDPDNAEVGQRNSVKSGINLLFKNVSTLKAQSPRVIAPVAAAMQGNQDIPLLTSTEMTNLILAYLAILDGYALNSAQYTDRRERSNNPRVKA